MKFLNQLKHNAVFQFFVPMRLPDNILSEMYAKVFKWTFVSVAVSAFLIYIVFDQNGPIYDVFMQSFIKVTSIISFREYTYIENPEPRGWLFSCSMFIALFYCFKYMERIPENVWDVGFKTILKLFLIFIFLGVLYSLGKKVIIDNLQQGFSLFQFPSILIASYIHALIGVNFYRVFLIMSAVYGIRKTTRSPYLGDTDKNQDES